MNTLNYSPEDFDPDNMSTENSDDKNKRQEKSKTSKKGNSKPSSDKAGKSFIEILTDKRTKILIGVIIALFTTFLTIASISFFKVGDEDQSVILNNTVTELSQNASVDNTAQDTGSSIAPTESKVKNNCGIIGAKLTHSLYTNGLGLGSLVLLFYLGYLSIALLRDRKIKFWQFTFKCAVIAVSTSIIVDLLTYNSHVSFFHLGGQHGHFVNQYLMTLAGVWGTIGVSILLGTIVALMFFNEICIAVKKSISAIKARQERILAEKGSETQNRHAEKEEIEAEDTAFVQPDVSFALEGIDDAEKITVLPSDDTEIEIEQSDNDDTTMIINQPTIEEAKEINNDVYDPTAELSRYKFPSIELLNEAKNTNNSVDQKEQEENKARITKTLNDFGISISKIEATVGPTVTLYEIIPAEGVRIAKIKHLENDIALSLAALGIRIIAPIPGRGTIGIEVPNKEPQIVSMRSVITSKKYQESKAELPIAIGATISNEVYITDLAKMPHLLVAGATGMGKSVGLNAIIASLLYKKHPAELKFVLIDPKMVEFSLYSKLEKHYLAKLPEEDDAIITDTSKVVTTLNSLCVEMDNRYSLLKDAGVRSVIEYNAKFTSRRLNPEKGHRYMPYIVVIVDEFADLIMTAGKEVETPIARIAQKARAIGIHMIIATQRPSVQVITGLIKANFPGRMAFRVAQMIDSRTILDRTGADQLIGKGDMLISRDGNTERVQCAFISTQEVEDICQSIDDQIGYDHAYILPDYIPEATDGESIGSITDRDPLFEDAARSIINFQTASTSSLQRTYSIGYNRAGRIMDQMEAAGIVGPASGGKPRKVLIDSYQLEQILGMN